MDRKTAPAPFTRDVGVRRIRSLTLATTIAGTAALAGFGVLAAVTNPGQQSTIAAGTSTTAGGPPSPGSPRPRGRSLLPSQRVGRSRPRSPKG